MRGRLAYPQSKYKSRKASKYNRQISVKYSYFELCAFATWEILRVYMNHQAVAVVLTGRRLYLIVGKCPVTLPMCLPCCAGSVRT